MSKLSIRLCIVCLAIASMACSKKIVTPAIAPPLTSSPTASLVIDEIDFEYFQGKARMILRDGNKERDVKATIRMRKDSVIWMNFTVIGVQGGKALINKDSITIVSTVDKEYYVFEYAELSKRYNFEINYQVIQDAMLGNLVVPRTNADEVSQEASFFLLKQQANSVSVVNFVNAASNKVEKIDMRESDSDNNLTFTYSNFQPVGNKIFPYNGAINLYYKTLAGLLNTAIIFEYNKAEVGDKELKFPFNIPKRYARR